SGCTESHPRGDGGVHGSLGATTENPCRIRGRCHRLAGSFRRMIRRVPAPQHRRSRVLVCDPLADEGLQILSQHFDVDVHTGLSEDEMAAIIGDYEAVVVRSATKITSRLIDRAERLRIVARAGAGLDTIGVSAAVDRGIDVINAPDANTLAVAELTVGLLVALARNITRGDAALKEGRWIKKELMGTGLAGKTIGIIGFGRIGQAVAT